MPSDKALQKKLEADTKTKGYQNKIRKLQSKILELQDKKKAGLGKRVSLVNAILNSRELFKAEIISKYPTTDVEKIFQEIDKLPQNHPIYQLWLKYKPELEAANIALAAVDASLNKIDNEIASEGAEMSVTYSQYDDSYKEAISVGVPTESPQEFNKTILAESILPKAEEGDLNASIEDLQAISMINPEAHAIVTQYNAEHGTAVGLDTQVVTRKKVLTWAAIGAGLFLLL